MRIVPVNYGKWNEYEGAYDFAGRGSISLPLDALYFRLLACVDAVPSLTNTLEGCTTQTIKGVGTITKYAGSHIYYIDPEFLTST